MREQVLMVGEDFGRSLPKYHHDLYALTGYSGRRLATLAGLTHLMFYMSTYRTNVVTLPDQWRDRELVAGGVERVRELMIEYRRTILLGSKVAAAMGLSHQDLFVWRSGVARMPHPSGRNHHWNDPDNFERARRFLTAALA